MKKTYYIVTMTLSGLTLVLFAILALTTTEDKGAAFASLILAAVSAGFLTVSILGFKNNSVKSGVILEKVGILLVGFSLLLLEVAITSPENMPKAIVMFVLFLAAGVFCLKKGLDIIKNNEENTETLLRNDEWNTYIEKLCVKMPFLRDTLRAGASIDDIRFTEAQIGVSFPDELKGLYLTNDGDDNEMLCGMLLGFHFLSLEDMRSEWQRSYSDTKWVPISSDGGGNFMGVDLTIDDKDSYGKVIFFGRDEKEKSILAKDLKEFFARFSRIVDSNDFYIGEYDDEKVILLGTDDIDEGAYTPDYLRKPDSVK